MYPFESLDELGFYLGFLALFLGILQFGLPYTTPLFAKMLRRRTLTEAAAIMRNFLALAAVVSLFMTLALVLIIFGRSIATMALFLSVVFKSSALAYLASILILAVGTAFLFWLIFTVASKMKLKHPKSDTEKLSEQIKELTEAIRELKGDSLNGRTRDKPDAT